MSPGGPHGAVARDGQQLPPQLAGTTHTLTAGDTAIVNAGATLAVENPAPTPATMWVTTSLGLEAKLADGTRISPPWAR